MAPASLTRRAIKAVASAADRFRPPAAGVVVLAYHRVGAGSGLEIDLDPGRFDEQMAVVAAAGNAVSLGTALERLALPPEDGPPSGGTVVVTFDDGTADFTDVALPIIARHRIPVTLYLSSSFVDRGRWPDGAPAVSWSGLADACATGLVDIGSHTHTHRLLDRAEANEVTDEFDRSVERIGERLDVRARDFAYPKAIPGSAAADRAVRERFRSAALAGTRANAYGRSDVYRLARSPIQVSDGMTFFARKLAGGMALEDGLRRTVNRVRYVGARS